MYKSTITAMGHMAMDFLDQNMLILFNDNAPEELAEIAVLHRAAPLEGTIEEGDIVTLGPDQFVIRAVGDQVNHTFSTMGHCTLMFNGQKEASLPGAIELSGKGLPSIKIGERLEISKGELKNNVGNE